MICIWSSWCHCHPIISCSSKIRNGLPFWCRLTQVVLEKRPLNGCSSSSSNSSKVACEQVVKIIWHKAASPPHIQSCSPGGASVHPLLIYVSLNPPTIAHPKRHLNRFSRFCRARDRDRPTDRQTDHATPSVTIGRIYVHGMFNYCINVVESSSSRPEIKVFAATTATFLDVA